MKSSKSAQKNELVAKRPNYAIMLTSACTLHSNHYPAMLVQLILVVSHMKRPQYSKNLETLIALVTHLAMTDWAARSPPNLAKALSIDQAEIENVLESFKGLFRKSKNPSKKTGAHFYALQLRHARQWLQDDDDEDAKRPPLEQEYLSTLLEFISHRAQEESARSLGFISAWAAAGATILVAIIAIIAN